MLFLRVGSRRRCPLAIPLAIALGSLGKDAETISLVSCPHVPTPPPALGFHPPPSGATPAPPPSRAPSPTPTRTWGGSAGIALPRTEGPRRAAYAVGAGA